MSNARNIFRLFTLAGMLAFLVASCASCGAALQPPKEPRTELSEVQRQRAVALHMMCFSETEGIKMWRGSGVIVGPHKVLTANHVSDCPSGVFFLTVTALGGEELTAEVALALPDYDIAMLTVDVELPYTPLVIAEAPAQGKVVCTESAIPVRSRACGKVTKLTDRKGSNVVHTGTVVPGNSGSGMYDSQGRLVGICTKTLTRGGKYVRGLGASLWEHRDRL